MRIVDAIEEFAHGAILYQEFPEVNCISRRLKAVVKGGWRQDTHFASHLARSEGPATSPRENTRKEVPLVRDRVFGLDADRATGKRQRDCRPCWSY